MKTKTGIKYFTEKTVNGKLVRVFIRLDDECNNKHCDFAITCSIYEKTRGGRWENVGGGADHETILKYFPGFADFVALHLCDCHGAPMYAIANGLYILKDKGAAAAAEYLRLTPEEVAACLVPNEPEYTLYALERAGILDRWEREAAAAIKHLEDLTGDTFENPYSPGEERRGAAPLSGDERAKIETLCASGYYTPEAIQARESARLETERQKARAAIVERFDREIAKAERQKAVYLAVFDILGTTDNVIYYDHTNTLSFNWQMYGGRRWVAEDVDAFRAALDDIDINDYEPDDPEYLGFEILNGASIEIR